MGLFTVRHWTKWKNSYWPPAVKRRKEVERLAELNEIHNANASPIYRLPPELVLDIAEQLVLVDKLCLRFACRRYALLLLGKGKVETDSIQWEAFKERIERDAESKRYFKLAESERLSSAIEADLLCSACHTTHPKGMFDLAEIRQSPHTRRCLGAKLNFHICPHFYLTYDGLKSRMLPGKSDFILDGCARVKRYGDGTWICNGNPTKTFICGSGVITIVDIRRHLRELAQQICPHLRTDGVYIQQILQQDCRRTHFVPWRLSGLPACQLYTLFITCFVENCATEFMVCSHERTILTYLRRDLGAMVVPSDPQWLAQLEDRPHTGSD